MPVDSNRVKELFIAALDLPDAAARHALLERECRDDAELRRRLDLLLAAHDRPDAALEQPFTPMFESAPTTATGEADEAVGTVVGGCYKLLQQIGEGGMGVVFMAEQTEPVRRRVALKIIKPGMDTAQVIARFESERQALALMDHPNIARVLDAGATESGRPYFVMELVKGVPITEFCDKNRLPAAQRLTLFTDVCLAIQHAHHKGIIHRDVKPSNVLVTLHDGVPVVKVIDFGVAKAIVQKLTERTLFTAFGQMVGTPAYMSPEQAEMSGLDVDTRSDVYSLGVLLYELLTGTTPFDKRRLREAAYDEVRRIIREEEPPRPSTRLSTLGDSATVLAGNRGMDPKQLARLLAGDLDWVAMKALDKDRERRYDSAGMLADDVRRYLRGEAIMARPPSTAYRLKRFAQRNRGPVLAGAALAVFFILGTVGTSVGSVWALRAERATDAERTRAAVAEERAAEREREIEVAKIHAKEVELIGKINEEQAKRALATIQQLLTAIHAQLGASPEAEKLRQEMLRLAMTGMKNLANEAEKSPATITSAAVARMKMSEVLRQQGDSDGAIAELARCLELIQQRADSRPDNAAAQSNVAAMQTGMGDLLLELRGDKAKALEYYRRAVAIRESLVQNPKRGEGALQPEVLAGALAAACVRAGTLLTRLGDPRAALPFLERAEGLIHERVARKQANDAEQSDFGRSCMALAEAKFLAGDFAAAEQYADRGVATLEALVLAKAQPEQFRFALTIALGTRSEFRLRTGTPGDARADGERSLRLARGLAAASPKQTDYERAVAMALFQMGVLEQRLGDRKSAQERFRDCAKLREELASGPKYAAAQLELMLVLPRVGRSQAAADLARTVVARSPNDPEVLVSAARCYAQCAAASDGPERSKYQDAALAALRHAVASGYKSGTYLQTEPDFDPIRERDEFKELLRAMPKPEPVR